LVVGLFAGSAIADYSVYDAVAEALRRDPRIQAARFNLEAADVDVNVARGGYYPQVTAEAGVDDGVTKTQYQVNVRQTLYDWGRVSSEVAGARAAGDRSSEELRLSQSDAALDAALTYLEYLRGRDVALVFEEYSEILGRFVRVAEARASNRFSGAVEVDRAR